ncbi:KH domain-containing, RNA-binding, signal transduction-associated protein 2-like isoform X1 [Vanessa cardui]|uniref:KH domain-containing, RNA-binding, signal transduction-associated protein 2-like isoform X1 n=2 Tax=Vanessa cardui TaxID=171605 RepID=UPI001F128F04|nr:KH domain-containing, RNA-binding, signal transduction-associated protein 2-like isoform X1 [Vanessa cardui]
MAEKYDKNGYNSSDFKRNASQDMAEHDHEQDGEEGSKLNEKAGEYMRELLSEKIKLNNSKFPISSRLIDSEVAKVQASGRVPPKDFKYLDVYREKAIKVTVKVLVPVKEHPKVNFVGKLLGPKGNTMKQLQEETMCKMAVLGRGSMRDRQKEEELRNSLDPKYAHLSDELHVEVSAMAPPAEAHARIAYALAEVKKYLIPDANDMIRQTQMREIMERDMGLPKRPLLDVPDSKSVVYSACTVTKHSFSYQDPVLRIAGAPPPPLAAPRSAAPRMPPAPMRPMPAKTKVFSILDRARSAMESSYSYEDPYAAPEPPIYTRSTQVPRGPRAAPEPEYYYERGQERYYEDDSYYKEEPREYKASARDVGTRRPGPSHAPRHYARASPYARAPKTTQKKRSHKIGEYITTKTEWQK